MSKKLTQSELIDLFYQSQQLFPGDLIEWRGYSFSIVRLIRYTEPELFRQEMEKWLDYALETGIIEEVGEEDYLGKQIYKRK